MLNWPMSDFDSSKPALVHDKLNDQTIDWNPRPVPTVLTEYSVPAGVTGEIG